MIQLTVSIDIIVYIYVHCVVVGYRSLRKIQVMIQLFVVEIFRVFYFRTLVPVQKYFNSETLSKFLR